MPALLPLRAVLAQVSRSFYLSLRLLPAETRESVALAYLLARAADTVADTEAAIPERRRELLASMADAIRCMSSLTAAVPPSTSIVTPPSGSLRTKPCTSSPRA